MLALTNTAFRLWRSDRSPGLPGVVRVLTPLHHLLGGFRKIGGPSVVP